MNMNYLTTQIIDQVAKQQNDLLEYSVRNFAVPPVKGEITKGKIQWRGISLIQNGAAEYGKIEKWLEQRGKRISPIITINFNSPIL